MTTVHDLSTGGAVLPAQSGTAEPAEKHECTVLVVDDAAVDRRVAGAIVEQTPGWTAVYADDGRTALAAVAGCRPHAVLTDLQMPDMNGLDLVAALRGKHPTVPVVLMTAFGSEDIAAAALRAGAASYVPKKSLDRDLTSTLERVLAAAQVERRSERLLGHLTRAEVDFTLENDAALVPPLVAHLQMYLQCTGLCDHAAKTRVGVALEESLLNAVFHGNLEVSSELRQRGDDTYHRLADERRRLAPYRDRRVHCTAKLSPAQAVYVVRDEGPGFDWSLLPDPTDPANLERASGRGLLLIHAFMDEVRYNAAGNEITLVKYRAAAGERPA